MVACEELASMVAHMLAAAVWAAATAAVAIVVAFTAEGVAFYMRPG